MHARLVVQAAVDDSDLPIVLILGTHAEGFGLPKAATVCDE